MQLGALVSVLFTISVFIYLLQILVGGNEINTLNLKWLRSHIGVVSQEPILFDTTIAENICYGKEGVTKEKIEEAARNANAHDFI